MTDPVTPPEQTLRHTNLPKPEDIVQPPGQVKQLPFTPANETAILKLISTDLNFALKWARCLYPDHFVNPYNQLLFRIIREFYLLNGRLPVSTAMEQSIKGACSLADPVHDIIYHWNQIHLLNISEHDPDFLKGILLEHVRSQDWHNFVLKAAKTVRDGKYLEISQQIGELMGRHRDTAITEEYSAKTIAARVAEELNTKPSIPTQYPTFNVNNGGGYEPGSVYLYMGPSGSGKSILLCNDGCHFLKQGKTVYHFTFELSADKTKARYDVCLTGSTHDERKKDPGSLDTKLKTLSTTVKLGQLYVIEYPTGTCDTNQVRASIEEHRMITGTKPDVIILDYLTIMRPNDTSSVDMKSNYDKQKVIAEEVRAVAMAMNIPIITAVQSNRGSVSKEVIHKDDIADSWGVIHVVDGVLSICQQDTERQGGKMRLYMAKSRNHVDSYTIYCDVDYTRLQITENVIETSNYNNSINSLKQTNLAMVKSAAANPGSGAPMPVPVPDPTTTTQWDLHHQLGNIGKSPFVTTGGVAPPAPPPLVPNAPIVAPVAETPAPVTATMTPPGGFPTLPLPTPLNPLFKT
jgi:KaiC/GvpD/RAD55 family RecA-like ATPase